MFPLRSALRGTMEHRGRSQSKREHGYI